MSGTKANGEEHVEDERSVWRTAIFSCGHGLKFLEKPTLKCGLEGREDRRLERLYTPTRR